MKMKKVLLGFLLFLSTACSGDNASLSTDFLTDEDNGKFNGVTVTYYSEEQKEKITSYSKEKKSEFDEIEEEFKKNRIKLITQREVFTNEDFLPWIKAMKNEYLNHTKYDTEIEKLIEIDKIYKKEFNKLVKEVKANNPSLISEKSFKDDGSINLADFNMQKIMNVANNRTKKIIPDDRFSILNRVETLILNDVKEAINKGIELNWNSVIGKGKHNSLKPNGKFNIPKDVKSDQYIVIEFPPTDKIRPCQLVFIKHTNKDNIFNFTPDNTLCSTFSGSKITALKNSDLSANLIN